MTDNATYVEAVLSSLIANEQAVLEDGGVPLPEDAVDFIASVVTQLLSYVDRTAGGEIGDVTVTPFARTGGGAHLLIDHNRSKTRVAVDVYPNGVEGRVFFTGPELCSPGMDIDSCTDLSSYFRWLFGTSGQFRRVELADSVIVEPKPESAK